MDANSSTKNSDGSNLLNGIRFGGKKVTLEFSEDNSKRLA